MRWTWLDLITDLTPGERCVALRNITWGEDPLQDHFDHDPEAGRVALPVMPNSLVIEGMAQCAGILVGRTGNFKHKVILAKIGRATFTGLPAMPGQALRHTATLDRFDDSGAATTGSVELIDCHSGDVAHYADIELMFSHIDQNRKGLVFPEHNFVFSEQFRDLLVRSGYSADF